MIRRRCFFILLTGLLLGGAARAQLVTNVVDRFDTNSYPTGSLAGKWSNWFGAAFQSLALDAAQDANTNATSGAMKITANFPVTTDQFEIWNGISGFSPAISGFQFTNFSCDVKFAAGSATNSSGKFGTLEFGVPTPGYGQNYFGNVVVTASNTNWVHVSIALNANSNTNLQNITGLLIHIWGAGLVGPSTLWLDNLQFSGNASSGTAVINFTNTAQRIDGFGASSAWMSGTFSTANADMYFSTNTGIGLSLLRTRIAPDGTSWETGIAQQAQARGARVWSTPWSPPVVFKSTNTVNGGSFSNSIANYQNYAAQLAKYAASMTNTYGVPLYALSIQNEPDVSTTYESCLWTSQQFHDFIPYLSAALTASNCAYTKIIFPESEFWSSHSYFQTNAMNDAAVAPLVGIIANHNYDGGVATITNWDKPLWETEVSTFDAYDGSITNGLYWAGRIHSFLTVAQVNAWHFWWLHGANNEGLTDNAFIPAKRMFALGNYSRFVRPNFFRLDVTNTAVALVSAFKDPASSNFAIVAANNSAFPINQTFVLTNFPVVGPLRQWVTSATESLANRGGAVSVTGGSFAQTLAPWTVTTFVYQQPVTNAPTIAQQPANQVALPGDAAAFSVQASGGTVALYYQWRFNDTNIAAATNATLALNSVALTNAGNYSVVVTNFVGSVTSAVVVLTVTPAPRPVFTVAKLSGTNLIFSGTNGGTVGSSFAVLKATNVATPLVNWVAVTTNQFGAGGSFNVTNPLNPALPQSFFMLRLP